MSGWLRVADTGIRFVWFNASAFVRTDTKSKLVEFSALGANHFQSDV